MLQITDPIHGYIELEGIFANIVNTPEFQRLRSVEQGSFRPVYPGARHDRFAHSLGTYHLAAKFVEPFFRNLEKDAGICLSEAQRDGLTRTFLYAALLHDIGHAPFSHTTEGFFAEKKGKNDLPEIWHDLCDAVRAVDPREGMLFSAQTEKRGAPHEIMSATILVSKWARLSRNAEQEVDLPLAARMVIGFTYSPEDLATLADQDLVSLGVRNCLIQMINFSLLDVDRLDYMGRDARMSGFINAPLDLDCLAQSVTAVEEDGMLVPAYRDAALRVFDLMFQAKLSHDAWVLAAPAGAYDAALLAHCIRKLNEKIREDGKTYMETIFSVEALSREGVDFAGKHYRLLSDVDVAADLKAQTDPLFEELYTRELGRRRIAAWRSYYEYHHLFNCLEMGLTPEGVYAFFKPLLKYLDKEKIFAFDASAYDRIQKSDDAGVVRAAALLKAFLVHASEAENDSYSVVLLDRISNFTMKLDPAQIRIVFPTKENGKLRLPLRSGKFNYSTYADMTGVTEADKRSKPYFYIMKKGGLGREQLQKLREMLADELNR